MAKILYALAIGNLMYAIVCTKPDIGHAVRVVSRFMSNPGKNSLGRSLVDFEISMRQHSKMFVLW